MVPLSRTVSVGVGMFWFYFNVRCSVVTGVDVFTIDLFYGLVAACLA